jgi:hypothetical protein
MNAVLRTALPAAVSLPSVVGSNPRPQASSGGRVGKEVEPPAKWISSQFCSTALFQRTSRLRRRPNA